MGPTYSSPCIEVPEEWKNPQDEECENCESWDENGEEVDHWWEIFKDQTLNNLEDQALESRSPTLLLLGNGSMDQTWFDGNPTC